MAKTHYSKRKPRNRLEKVVWDFLEARDVTFEYEGYKIPYTISSTYTPDFFLFPTVKDRAGIFVETKGFLRPEDKRKMAAVKTDNPDLDIRFVFHPKSKPADIRWAIKNGFPYAVGQIPVDWLT